MLMVNQLVGFQAVAADDFSAAALSLNAWWDPSDLTTLWQDTGRTTAVTADGQTVGCMDDKTGNGRHLKFVISTPVYKTSGGLHWLEFNGSSQYLETTQGMDAFVSASAAECVAAFRITSPETDSSGLDNDACFADHSGYSTYGYARSSGLIGVAVYNPSFSVVSRTAAYSSATDVVISCGWDASNMRLSKDNAADSTISFTPHENSYNAAVKLRLGRDNNTRYAQLRFYGGAFKSTTMTAGDRTAFCTWLGAKQGRSI